MKFSLWIMLASWVTMCLSACSVNRELSTTPRTPVEQLLITQSIERSLDGTTMPLKAGEAVAVETAGMTADKDFGRDVIGEWLGRRGLHVGNEGAAYVIRVVWYALGTEQSETF